MEDSTEVEDSMEEDFPEEGSLAEASTVEEDPLEVEEVQEASKTKEKRN